MAIVPLAFFTFFVVAAAGGPKQFVKATTRWLGDFVAMCVRWVESLS